MDSDFPTIIKVCRGANGYIIGRGVKLLRVIVFVRGACWACL